MADTRISDLAALTGAGSATGDLAVVVDISDTSMAASGTDKKMTLAELAIGLTTHGSLATDAELAAYLPLLAAGAAVENVGAIESNVNTVATTGATETLDTSVYAVHDCTMDQNCTFTFSNPAPSGKNSTFMLILRGAFTATLPAAVKWSSGTPPTYTTPSVYVFTTIDAGTTWLAQQVGRAFA